MPQFLGLDGKDMRKMRVVPRHPDVVHAPVLTPDASSACAFSTTVQASIVHVTLRAFHRVQTVYDHGHSIAKCA